MTLEFLWRYLKIGKLMMIELKPAYSLIKYGGC